MKKIDIDELTFRCHSAGKLMGIKGLGVTGEKEAIKTYIEKATNRAEEIKSDYLEKGILNEEEGIIVLSDHLQVPLVKNQDRVGNEYLEGECDTLHSDWIYDIKNCYSIQTFEFSKISADETKIYECQGRGYLELFEAQNYGVARVLLNLPDNMLLKKIEKESYHYNGDIPDYEVVKMVNLHIFDTDNFVRFLEICPVAIQSEKALALVSKFIHIPIEERINIKTFERSKDKIDAIYSRVKDARTFLKTIYKNG
jgi:hypothetical protein